jgi:hypothetical protein
MFENKVGGQWHPILVDPGRLDQNTADCYADCYANMMSHSAFVTLFHEHTYFEARKLGYKRTPPTEHPVAEQWAPDTLYIARRVLQV